MDIKRPTRLKTITQHPADRRGGVKSTVIMKMNVFASLYGPGVTRDVVKIKWSPDHTFVNN